ncbi:MAG: hypothetical protein WCX74_02335 [Candidatus Paceibacterota bacterium]
MTSLEPTNEYYGKNVELGLVDPSISDKVLGEERKISNYYNECYQVLSPEMLELLRNLRGQIQQRVVQYIRGEISLAGLREREREFLAREHIEFKHFIESNPNNPFILKVEGEYERLILDNFVKKQTMISLEQEVNRRDKEKARALAEKLGIRKQEWINN